MPEITIETQKQAAEDIHSQFRALSEIVQEHHEAYKLTYELAGKFEKFRENSFILASKPSVYAGVE